jgi:Pvc16 N-terminal domain
MIPSVTQTLAKILVHGTSLLSTEQIDFTHPRVPQNTRPRLNLYCYNIQENRIKARLTGAMYSQDESLTTNLAPNLASNLAPNLEMSSLRWFDVSFLVSVWDWTSLGEQHLLSEALLLFLQHRRLKEDLLAPALRGYGELQMTVSALSCADAAVLWSALDVPLRPALYVTVTIPFEVKSDVSTSSVETCKIC